MDAITKELEQLQGEAAHLPGSAGAQAGGFAWKRKRPPDAEDGDGNGDAQHSSKQAVRSAVLAELYSNQGWEFAKLPRPRRTYELPTKLPDRLKELLHVQPTLLRQLSLVKLRILARAYLKLYPNSFNDGAATSEGMLCNLMQEAIRDVIPDWKPVTSLLPKWPHSVYIVDREAEVTACIAHWLRGWVEGRRGRKINICCQPSCMGKTTLMQVLGNPVENLIDAFVAAVDHDNALDALMALLCARLVHVRSSL